MEGRKSDVVRAITLIPGHVYILDKMVEKHCCTKADYQCFQGIESVHSDGISNYKWHSLKVVLKRIKQEVLFS